MSYLIPTLQAAIAGAQAQALPDVDVRKIVMSIVDDDKQELNTADTADYINKSTATLKRWRKLNIGPKYRKDPGGAIRYRIDWLREFQQSGVVN